MTQAIATTAPEEQTVDQESGCPECGGDCHREATQQVCADCGLIVSENTLDRSGETHYPDDETDTRRTGPPLTETRHDRGLSTEIGWDDTDANGNQICGRKRRQLSRIRYHHNVSRTRSKVERNRGEAFTEIDRMCGALGLASDRREQACLLFRQAQEANLLMGRSIEGVAAAAIFAISRIHELGLTIDEVAATARVGRQRIRSCYATLNQDLGIPTPPPRPETYIPRIAADIDVISDVVSSAASFARAYRDEYPSKDPNPRGVAAGALYTAVQREGVEVVPQHRIATAAKVSENTLRKHAKLLRAMLKEGESDGE